MITCGTQVVSGSTGGGGASLPAAPADALLDAGSPSTVLGLNASGVGEALSASAARSRIAVVPSDATPLVESGGGAAGSSANYSRADHVHPAASGSAATWLDLLDATALYIGGESATGFGSADYVTASAASAVPAFGPGQSLVVCLYPTATPTGIELAVVHRGGSATRGWLMGVGMDTGNRRRVTILMQGLNGSAEVNLAGSEITSGSAYVIAIVVKADKSVRYSVNGAAVQTVAALSGSYTAPTSADTYDVGSTRAYGHVPATYPLTSALLGEVRTYSTELSDADLVAACAGVATGTIPDVATGTVSTRFLPQDFAGPVRVKAQTGVTWVARGGIAIRPV